MTFKIERLAGQQVLARMMKMKLQQLVSGASDDTQRTRICIHLDRVPIIDDPEFHVVIGDIQPAKLRRHRIRQIDR